MKTEKNILIAFLLNLTFSVFELVGGIVTGSIAILSDALHDIGDATGIGMSYFLERKSKKQPDEAYTYGYLRYSVLGGLINTVILSVASVLVIFNAVKRIVNPLAINYDGMIIFALIGTAVNLAAACFTSGGKSVNQKAVNLHMLEDVFGWVLVLIGGTVMKFTDISIIDPIISVGVSAFILINALRNLGVILDLFLEKTPEGISVKDIKEHLMEIEGVKDVHHIHIRSIDAVNNYATLHVVTDEPGYIMKNKIKEELRGHGINHVTVELESSEEHCCEEYCFTEQIAHEGHHHHHHHH
jgi:cobalt-zinc-cadmium efflux system protein